MPVLICRREKLWTRTYSTGDQVPTCPVFTRAKIKSRLGDFSQFAVTIAYFIYTPLLSRSASVHLFTLSFILPVYHLVSLSGHHLYSSSLYSIVLSCCLYSFLLGWRIITWSLSHVHVFLLFFLVTFEIPTTRTNKWGVSYKRRDGACQPMGSSVSHWQTNLFSTLKLFWSPD